MKSIPVEAKFLIFEALIPPEASIFFLFLLQLIISCISSGKKLSIKILSINSKSTATLNSSKFFTYTIAGTSKLLVLIYCSHFIKAFFMPPAAAI